MTEYLENLLLRLNNDDYRPGETSPENCWESAKTISYEARIEIQQLADESLLDELIQIFSKNTKSENASNLLFIITSITSNTSNKKGTEFIYDLLVSTKDKRFLSHCLGFYSHRASITQDYSITPFVQMFDHKTESIRIGSYYAIANSLHDNKESILLKRLMAITKPYETEKMLMALSICGTENSLLHVEKYLKNKSSRVRGAAKICIANINMRKGNSPESELEKFPV